MNHSTFKAASDTKRLKRAVTTYEKVNSAGTAKVFDPEIQSFTKRAFRIVTSQIQENSKQQPLTFEKLCQKILYALDHYYSEDLSGFYVKCKDFLSKDTENWKLKVIDRMNTYDYLEMAVAYKPFEDIQVEIIKEWKKNYLLFAIMTFWYSTTQNFKFKQIKQFQQKYEIYRNFIAQINGLIFQNCLRSWQKRNQKNQNAALENLCEHTSHLIITDSSEFKKVYEKVMIPLIDCEFLGKTINWELDLKKQPAKKWVFDTQKQENLPKTIQVMRRYSKQLKLSKKIELLRQYRLTMLSELQSQQQELIKKSSQPSKPQVPDKDDFIDALIYCIIKGRLEELKYAFYYFTILLGDELYMLNRMQLASYAIDIKAAIDSDSLTVQRIDNTNFQKQQLIIKEHMIAIKNRTQKTSSFQEDNDFLGIIIQKQPRLMIKQTTVVEEKKAVDIDC